MEDGFKMMSSTFGGYETRLKAMESFVNTFQGLNDSGDFGVDDYSPPSRFWTKGDCFGGGQKDLKEPESGVEKETHVEAEKEPESGVEKETQAEGEKEPESGVEKETHAEGEKEPESGVEKVTQAEAEEEPKEAEKEAEAEGEKEPEAQAEKGERSEVEKEAKAEAEEEEEAETEEENEVVGEKRIKKPAPALRTPYMVPNPAERTKKN
ncbi:unnamed protein product [Arabis nemorensis]|uniref:Uncharacterized protein n=1 Tax=Arabis nemorensis TaxID=586526 RepID=A0A565BKI7_9BRAS|nr:unnamed protein product [Arabis nemorensis]